MCITISARSTKIFYRPGDPDSRMSSGRSISKRGWYDSSSKHPNGIYPSPQILIQLPRSTRVEQETRGCFDYQFAIAGPRICVSVYLLRSFEWGEVLSVVVRRRPNWYGGSSGAGWPCDRCGFIKPLIAPPGLATWSRIEIAEGGHVPCMYVIVRWA